MMACNAMDEVTVAGSASPRFTQHVGQDKRLGDDEEHRADGDHRLGVCADTSGMETRLSVAITE